MSEHELLYDNKFINTNVDGIRNDEKDNLLNYLDEIENERSNQLRKEKSKIQKLRDEPIEQKAEYRKTLVNIDSRLRTKYPVNIKDSKIHRLENTKYQIIDSIRLIRTSVSGTPILYTAELILSEYLNLSANMYIWLTITTWYNSDIANNMYNIENKFKSIKKFERRYFMYFIVPKSVEPHEDSTINDISTNSSYKYNPNLTYLQLPNSNEQFKITEIEIFAINGDNNNVKLKITFTLNVTDTVQINRYIAILNNQTQMRLSIAKKNIDGNNPAKLSKYNGTLRNIDKFESKYYIEIDTDSTEFEKDPEPDPNSNQLKLISVAVDEVDKYLRISSNNINTKFKLNSADEDEHTIDYTYFYINQITLFNNTSEIQITHPSHGLNNFDKISFNMDWQNKLFRTGGLIYKYIIQGSNLRIYIDHDLKSSISTNYTQDNNEKNDEGNIIDEHVIFNYLKQVLEKNQYISLDLDLKYTSNGKTLFELKRFDNVKILNISEKIDGDNAPNGDLTNNLYEIDKIDQFDKFKFYFEVNNAFESFNLNGASKTIIDQSMISFSYNNMWYIPYEKKIYSNSNTEIQNSQNNNNFKYNKPFYTIKNNEKLFVFHYNHNLTYPVNISGKIIKIEPVGATDFDHATRKLKFYTYNVNLRENLKIFFDFEKNQEENVPYTFLKLKKNKPYIIYNVNYYTNINKINRSFDINQKYQTFDIDIDESDLLKDETTNILKYKNQLNLQNYESVLDSNNLKIQRKGELIKAITPLLSFNVNKYPLDYPNHLESNKSLPTLNNNIVDIFNIKKEKININSIQIFKPYVPDLNLNSSEDYLIQNNYIESISLAKYPTTDLTTNQEIQKLFAFKFTFHNDVNLTPNFNIRNYVNNGIILRYLTKKFDISNNKNKPFTVLYADDDVKPTHTLNNVTKPYTGFVIPENDKNKIIYVRFADWDKYVETYESKSPPDNDDVYTTKYNYGFWQPADSIWLQIKINIDISGIKKGNGYVSAKDDPSYNNIENLKYFLQNNEKVKIPNLNIPNIDNERSYIIKNISKQYSQTPTPDNKFNIFLINLQIQDVDILSQYIDGRNYELITPGEVNIFEIEKSSPINYINRHMYSIDLIPNSNYPHFFGNSYEDLLKKNGTISKLLAIGNIPDEFINADNPISNDRKNGFHKIKYIDENNYIIVTNSNIVTYYNKDLYNNNNYFDEINNKIYINPDRNTIYYKYLDSDPTKNKINKIEATIIKLKIQKINKIEQGFLNQNYYIYKFGRTFENITEIKMISSEFPNSSQVINNTIDNTNNKIFWRILDDGPYEYEAELEPGNYSANSLKLEIQDKMNQKKRSFNSNKLQEIIVIIDSAKSKIEFMSFKKTTLGNKLSIAKNSNRLEITFLEPHYLNDNDIIIISNSTQVGGINASLINKEHFANVINKKQIYVNLTADASIGQTETGGKKLIIRNLIPMQILWGKSNTFGKLLGFNRSGEPNYVQPPFMRKISNIEYNKYNDSDFPNIFEISGENYVLILNKLLSNIDNNNKIKDIFAKVLLPAKSGSWVFNSFLSKSTKFKHPIKKLSELEFKFKNFLGNPYDFNGLDHSFTLEITEEISKKEIKTYNSKDL